MRRRGLLLFSGGIDSTLSALLLKETTELVALTVAYPGRPEGERIAASELIRELRFDEHVEIALGMPLTPTSLSRTPGCVPYRNLVIWSLAAHEAVKTGATFIAGGHTPQDASVYSDASPVFFERLDQLLELTGGQDVHKIDILLPMTLDETPKEPELLAAYGDILTGTWSCWVDAPAQCGRCYACRERAAFFGKR